MSSAEPSRASSRGSHDGSGSDSGAETDESADSNSSARSSVTAAQESIDGSRHSAPSDDADDRSTSTNSSSRASRQNSEERRAKGGGGGGGGGSARSREESEGGSSSSSSRSRGGSRGSRRSSEGRSQHESDADGTASPSTQRSTATVDEDGPNASEEGSEAKSEASDDENRHQLLSSGGSSRDDKASRASSTAGRTTSRPSSSRNSARSGRDDAVSTDGEEDATTQGDQTNGEGAAGDADGGEETRKQESVDDNNDSHYHNDSVSARSSRPNSDNRVEPPRECGDDQANRRNLTRQQEEEASATKIQRKVRKRQATGRIGQHDNNHNNGVNSTARKEEAESGTKIQRKVRYHQARATAGEHARHNAATRIQARTRGNRTRRQQRGSAEPGPSAEDKHAAQSKEKQEAAIASKRGDLSADHNVEQKNGPRKKVGGDGGGRGRKKEALGEEEAARPIQGQIRRKSPTRKETSGNHHHHPPTSHNEAEDEGRSASGVALEEDEAARRIQRKVKLRRGRDAQVGSHAARSAGIGRNNADEEALKEDEAARRIQRRARQGKRNRLPREGRESQREGINDQTELEENEAARRIQSQVRGKQARRRAKDGRNRRKQAHEEEDDDRREFSLPAERTTPRKDNLTTNSKWNQAKPSEEGTLSEASRGNAAAALAARSPSPSRPQKHPASSWMSPGRAAANAATAAANEAARAAAASVRAAEAAADAAEAAEAAAEAEEEMCCRSTGGGGAFRSPPAASELRERRRSPSHEAFWQTEGDKEGVAEHDEGARSSVRPKAHASTDRRGYGKGGESGDGATTREGMRHRGQDDGGGGKHKDYRAPAASGRGDTGEEEMLRKARNQARRHARDRRARAIAKEEESKRELHAVQAELIKAEELRDRQTMAEKSALEAKRARVLEDMKRRQQRLQRLQEEEGMLSRRGDSSPSRSSSADLAAAPAGGDYRTGARRDRGDVGASRGARGEESGAVALSLPPLVRGGGAGTRRRKPRHVSTFRERILEERRARKEIDILKRKEIEEKHTRQADYAAKIRAQAKRVLAAEQRRAQEDAARSARRSGHSSSVDRTPIAIKRPKHEGEWGVFSYAPDQPAGGMAPRKAQGRASGGRLAASGFGSTEKVQERLGSSELVERMRKERARATEASRARAAAAAAAAAVDEGGTDGGEEYHRGTGQEDSTGYRASEPNGTAYQASGLHGQDVGYRVGGGSDAAQRHRPSPPAQLRDGAAIAGGRGLGGRGGGGGGGRGGRLGATGRYQGGRSSQPVSTKVNAGGDAEDVHAMYEERLAALERRLAGAGKQTHRQKQHQLRPPPKEPSQPPPRGARGGEEWGVENNPFGYGKLSAGEDERSYGSMPSSSSVRRAQSQRGSEASEGEDVEGLSTMYIGPIAHKMAKLRAGNG